MFKHSDNIIAIDGPSSSGKGTLAKKLAEKLGYSYLDTGAMYRALSLALIKHEIDVMNESTVLDVLKKCQITFDQKGRVFLNNIDVSKEIRSQDVAAKIAFIAAYPSVRKLMVAKQRACANEKGAVLDGRDIGTVVFPKAKYKFFISASLKERARRRGLEYLENGDLEGFHHVLHDLAQRDFSDIYRHEGPLQKADDALVIDTTNLNVEEALEQLFHHIKIK